MPVPICVVFDIGKTNKKILAFNRSWQVVYEKQTAFDEISDDDGFHGDDLNALTSWMSSSFAQLESDERFEIKALNFSGYGASMVHLSSSGEVCTPFFNYLKSIPRALKSEFLTKYGPAEFFFSETASPDLGLLNSGLQLYWLKYAKPDLYKKIDKTLHFPQYLSYIFSRQFYAEKTSIGCHTAMWSFEKNAYHSWIEAENIKSHLVPLLDAGTAIEVSLNDQKIKIGVGLHDSSAALVPYLSSFSEPFVLISTGTWNICLNPFNGRPVTVEELSKDCLSFISYQGKHVKASRLFAGNEHQRQIKHLAGHFGVDIDYFKTIKYNSELIKTLRLTIKQALPDTSDLGLLRECPFVERNINVFDTPEVAYHQFMLDLVAQQIASIKLVLTSDIKTIFVDGGFTKNQIFMKLLAEAFHQIQVFGSQLGQGSSMGAALAIADSWQPEAFGQHLFELDRA